MTNIQAIDLLKGLEQSLDDYCELNDEGKATFRMAITALELFGNAKQLPSAQQWIPVSERLPEDSGWYIVTKNLAYDTTWVGLEWYNHENGWKYDDGKCIAWMPLPKSYRGDEDGK